MTTSLEHLDDVDLMICYGTLSEKDEKAIFMDYTDEEIYVSMSRQEERNKQKLLIGNGLF